MEIEAFPVVVVVVTSLASFVALLRVSQIRSLLAQVSAAVESSADFVFFVYLPFPAKIEVKE